MSRVRFSRLTPAALLVISLACATAAMGKDFDLTSSALQGTAVTGTDRDDFFFSLINPDAINPTPPVLLRSIDCLDGDDRIEMQFGTVAGTTSPYAVNGGSGNDTILFNSANPATAPVQIGGSGFIPGAPPTAGTAGPSPGVTGGDGDDTVIVSSAILYGNLLGEDGADSLQVFGTDIAKVAGSVKGGNGNDQITVFGGAEIGSALEGGDGDDEISWTSTGTLGSNHVVADNVKVISAGNGDDTVSMDIGSGTINGDIDGGSGLDSLYLNTVADTTLTSDNEITNFNRIYKTGEAALTIDQNLTTGSLTLQSQTPSDESTTGGSIVIAAGRTLTAGSSIIIDNGSTFQLAAGSQLAANTTQSINVINGTFDDNSGGNIAITNTAQVQRGTFETDGDLSAANLVVIQQTSNATTATIAGTLDLNATKHNAGTGNLTVGGGTLNVTGDATIGRSATFSGGTSTFAGAFTTSYDATDTQATGNFTVTGTTVDMQGLATIGNNASIIARNATVTFGDGIAALGHTVGGDMTLTEVNDNTAANAAADTTKVTLDVTANSTLDVAGNLIITNNSNHTSATKDQTLTVNFGDAVSKINVAGTTSLVNGVINATGHADGTIESGDLIAATGGTIDTYIPNLNTTGAGGIIIGGGTTVTGTSNYAAGGAGNIVITGTSNLTTSGTITSAGDLTITDNSTLTTTNDVTVAGELTIGTGSTLTAKTGPMIDVDDFTMQSGSSTLGEFTLDISGTGVVRSGATLAGVVTIQGTGSITYEPGSTVASGNSIGNQDININTTWNQANIVVEFDATNSDTWTVNAPNGQLTINGGTITPTPDNTLITDFVQHDYLFLIDNGGTINAPAPAPTVVQSTPVYAYSVTYDGNNQATLHVTRNTYQSIVTSANQQTTAAVFNGQLTTGSADLQSVLIALDAVPNAADLGRAFDQLGPEPYANLLAINFEVADMFADQCINRMTRLAETSDCPPNRHGPCADRFGYMNPSTCQKQRYTYAYDTPGRGVWVQNIGNWTRQDFDSGRLGWESSMYGLMLGWDGRNAGMVFGGDVAFATQRVDFYGANFRDNADYFNASFYGGWNQCGDFIMFGGGYTYAANHVYRSMNFDSFSRTAQANAYNNIASGFFKAGKALPTEYFGVLTPTIGGRIHHGNIDAFSESGASSVTMQLQRMFRDSMQVDVGGRWSFDLAEAIRMELYGEYVIEMGDLDSWARAQYAFGDNISLMGMRHDASFGRFGARANFGDPTGWLSGFVRYDGVLRNNYQSHSGSVGLLLQF